LFGIWKRDEIRPRYGGVGVKLDMPLPINISPNLRALLANVDESLWTLYFGVIDTLSEPHDALFL